MQNWGGRRWGHFQNFPILIFLMNIVKKKKCCLKYNRPLEVLNLKYLRIFSETVTTLKRQYNDKICKSYFPNIFTFEHWLDPKKKCNNYFQIFISFATAQNKTDHLSLPGEAFCMLFFFLVIFINIIVIILIILLTLLLLLLLLFCLLRRKI